MDDCIDIYNITNKYIKKRLTVKTKYKLLNFRKLRKKLTKKIKIICDRNGLNKHTGDYALKHCVEMYKSAVANIPTLKFDIKDLDKTRRRKNLVIEPDSLNKMKTTIFYRQLGQVKSNLPFDIIKKQSILQYDTKTGSCCIIVPIDKHQNIDVKQYKKCAIDVGVRTFLTTYSPAEVFEIGTDTYKCIDRYNKKFDSINKNKKMENITQQKYERLIEKYGNKLRNHIKDMHHKAANFLLSKYENILIGKISIKRMISNKKSTLNDKSKRRFLALNHYHFRMKLIEMSKRFGSTVKEINEYKTSIKCSKCGNEHKTLGANKIYKCENCGIEIDRDINAAINIYKNDS